MNLMFEIHRSHPRMNQLTFLVISIAKLISHLSERSDSRDAGPKDPHIFISLRIGLVWEAFNAFLCC